MKAETPIGASMLNLFLLMFISCILPAQAARGVEPAADPRKSVHEALNEFGFEVGYGEGFM